MVEEIAIVLQEYLTGEVDRKELIGYLSFSLAEGEVPREVEQMIFRLIDVMESYEERDYVAEAEIVSCMYELAFWIDKYISSDQVKKVIRHLEKFC